MAAYCTPQDVLAAFGKIMTTGMNPTEIAALCEDWSDYIDGHIAQRYITPVSPVPRFLNVLTTQLVYLDLLDRMPGPAPDFIVRRLARIDGKLNEIATGLLILPEMQERLDVGMIQSSTSQYVPTFGAVPSLTETFDPNRLNDEINERNPDVPFQDMTDIVTLE